MRKKYVFIVVNMICLLFAYSIKAQSVLKGKVSDIQGVALQGVSIKISDAGTVTTDANGQYAVKVSNGRHTVTFSYIGYSTQTKQVMIQGEDIVLNAGLEISTSQLGEVVVSVGSRSGRRTITDSPIPIDVVGAADIQSTGQVSFDKALEYRVPSFNTVNTPVNDATSLLDPYEIRNMGPSRTLILINGKRKNSSSLTYVQTSPGQGESGADISAIPTDAIKRVEILRDGASAQYGSDAIAGVMNIILKDRFEYGTATLNTGITGKGDGKLFGISLNNGANFGEKGFFNYTVDLSHISPANRAGNIDPVADFNTLGGGTNPATGNPYTQADATAYIAKFPDGNNKNETSQTAAAKFLINSAIPVNENSEVYFNAAYVYKKVNSFANYRVPYWKQDPYNLLHAAGTPYIGFQPSFDGDLNDYNGTVGLHTEKNGFKTDISFTTGGNQQLYTVNNTLNKSLGKNSPTSFKPGGFSFTNNIGNIDISKKVDDQLTVSAGAEFRAETYKIIAGDTASYSGSGAISFPGYSNPVTATRSNFGGYADLAYDIDKQFLINGTARLEQYSDFGSAFVWKFSSRYKFANDKVVLRSSISTGFRAPSAAQINLQLSQASFSGGTIISKGLLSNNSTTAAALGVPKLQPEKSVNFTAGIGINPVPNFSITLDYYNITVNNRVVLSQDIAADPTNPSAAALNAVLANTGVSQLQFFLNGLDTRTEGLDFVASYRKLPLGRGKLGINLAGNYTLQNKMLRVKNPPILSGAGISVINETITALLLTSRPKHKAILGIDYAIGNWSLNLNNTMFGPATFQQADLADESYASLSDIKTVFATKVVTDLGASVRLSKTLTASVTIQNLFNVLPKWRFVALTATGQTVLNDPSKVKDLSNDLTFNGRYPITTYDGSHFSQIGTTYAASLKLSF